MEQAHLHVTEPSQVGEARRRAVALAAAHGVDEDATGTLALAVTEVATNVLKHGRGGAILIRALDDPAGVEVIALDRGPGIANVAACLRDGHSTAGTPGYGLGTLVRITTGLDIYTQAGKGTVLRFAVHARRVEPAAKGPTVGVICVAKPGQDVSGDGWSVVRQGGALAAMVVDGLGHGQHAADAAGAARRTLVERAGTGAERQMHALHEALRPTRGAAAALCSIGDGGGTFCGVGNIRAFLRDAASTRHLVSHPGTLGHQVRKVQTWPFAFGPGTLLLMHSDGLQTQWSLGDYPGLDARHPAVIAGVAFRDHWRRNDDATVLVLKADGGRA
ncbi:MAG TPA: ATP-binding protein [Casimicrobiaceae bacterium]|nr:ATP-binding protein [Casimicrobiaceae bacterium]